MVINKKVNRIYKFSILQVIFFLLKFFGTVFVTSKISSHVISELPIILSKDLIFLQAQVHALGSQI